MSDETLATTPTAAGIRAPNHTAIVDGHAQFFRAYYAIRGGLNSPVTAEPTNLTFGFISTLFSYIRNEKPRELIVVIDAAGDTETFRSAMFPAYKANRDPAPDDFHPQVVRCLEALALMGIPVLGIEGVEADDVIATLVRRKRREQPDARIRMISRDKDLGQLVDHATTLFDPHKNADLGLEQLFDSKGIAPTQVIDFLALMGPSGSGKTTLLNMLGGIDSPTQGLIEVGGVSIGSLSGSGLSRWRATHVGFVFQLYNLLPALSAERNVELPLLLTSLKRAERRSRANLALKVVGLADRANHYPRQLSGGQEQRVGIARAIVTDPTLLLCDEPTGDLDRKAGDEILELLQTLNREYRKTIVMVTHDPRAAERAQRTLHLDKGVLVESATA